MSDASRRRREAEAARARERERQRERERAAIRAEINAVNARIREANQLINEFSKCNANLSGSLSQWRAAYSVCQGNEMTSLVFVKDRFEGCVAEKFSEEFPAAINKMQATCTSVDSVKSSISSQIQKLQAYVAKLESQIRSLQARLASI